MRTIVEKKIFVALVFLNFNVTMERFREQADSLRYMTDDKGNRLAVVIPIDRFGEILEDLADLELVSKRLNETLCNIDELNRPEPNEGVL